MINFLKSGIITKSNMSWEHSYRTDWFVCSCCKAHHPTNGMGGYYTRGNEIRCGDCLDCEFPPCRQLEEIPCVCCRCCDLRQYLVNVSSKLVCSECTQHYQQGKLCDVYYDRTWKCDGCSVEYTNRESKYFTRNRDRDGSIFTPDCQCLECVKDHGFSTTPDAYYEVFDNNILDFTRAKKCMSCNQVYTTMKMHYKSDSEGSILGSVCDTCQNP